MLSALYSHAEAWPVDSHQSTGSDSDTGSFDNTPSPSNRPSLSITRPVIAIGAYDHLPANTQDKDCRRRHPSRLFSRMIRGYNYAEKEPLILLQDKTEQNYIPLQKISNGSELNSIDGVAKENPYRTADWPKKPDKKRSSIGISLRRFLLNLDQSSLAGWLRFSPASHSGVGLQHVAPAAIVSSEY
ncbi:hypothetical protein MY11210_008799 [Beauveria gryllotalpidicola]